MISRKPVVWVVQSSVRNIEPARKFGTIEVLVLQSSQNDPSTMAYIYKTLLTEMEEGDYILPIGSPLYIGVAFVAANQAIGGFKVLMYDRKTADYNVIPVTL